MKGKNKDDYHLFFRKLNEHLTNFLDIGEEYILEEIHTDFEIAVGEACRLVYPEVKIKYCIWHMKRALNLKKNELCKEEVSTDNNCFILYNMLCNLYLCPINYVLKIFNKIKNNSENEKFDDFIK